VPDFLQREMLRGRADILRARADTFLARLGDRAAKELITGFVAYRLDAIERFWLAERRVWPEFEIVWLHNAETELGLAERSFAHYEKLFAKYIRSGSGQHGPIDREPGGV
jgi:hypothetical protein